MPDSPDITSTPIRCELFVDFENVHDSLGTINRLATEKFATEPARWIKWFEMGNHEPTEEPVGITHKHTILVRRCYLNPAKFSKYRGYFTRAGFSVIDCPPLTAGGKNSADIHMVLDIIDTLAHPTPFEEFIILSADADFTPVLIRLRAHDRRTTIFTNAVTAATFKAACDFVIDQETFFEKALGIVDEVAEVAVDLQLTSEELIKLRQQIMDSVRERLAEADAPIDMASVAYSVIKRIGKLVIETRWAGVGSFKNLLTAEDQNDIAVLEVQPGYVYDPNRHDASVITPTEITMPAEDRLAELPTEFASFIQHVNTVTDVPALPPSDYRVMFEMIVDAVEQGYEALSSLSRMVRDLCAEKGCSISRKSINFVLLGLRLRRFDLRGRQVDEIAREWRDNVVSLCENAGLVFTDPERDMLGKWFQGDAATLEET